MIKKYDKVFRQDDKFLVGIVIKNLHGIKRKR